MTIDDDRQYKTNDPPGAVIQFLADLDTISADELSDTVPNDEPIEGPKPPSEKLQAAVRAKSEHIKEHDTRYNQNKRDWEAIDAYRQGEGHEEFLAKRRGEYAGQIMESERRRVRPYRVPDSEQKRKRRSEQKKASKQRKLDAMTPEERKAHTEEESAKRAARRAAAKKS